MIKSLLKKQLLEVFSWIYYNKKTGKSRTKVRTLLFVLFYFILIFGFLGSVFFGVASMLCEPLVSVGLGWLYFAIMGLIAIALGVFGSVFDTYTSLYQAKDNDLLLSMPIPVSGILGVRLMGVYLMGLMYQLIVSVPTLIVWFMQGGSAWALQLPVVLSFFILTLSCVFGWVVALISSKIKGKSFITVALALIFFAGYYYLYGNAYSMLQKVLADPQMFGERLKGVLYPFYHMGMGAQGSVISVLIFAAMVLVLFAVVYVILSRSFIAIATANKGTKKTKYRAKRAKAGSVDGALFRKELHRFTSSAGYMLNCGLGIVMMLIAAAALFIKGGVLAETLNSLPVEWSGIVVMLAVEIICMVSSMNDITAPSVSLEGKSIWLVQSLPVRPQQVLMAKLKLHLVMTVIPAMILVVAVEWVLRPVWYYAVLIPVVTVAFILFMALLGLVVNLKMPNLNWTSESIPIKQSAGVMIALFGGWGILLVLGVVYFLLAKFVPPVAYLCGVGVVLFALSALLIRWTKTRGAAIFEAL